MPSYPRRIGCAITLSVCVSVCSVGFCADTSAAEVSRSRKVKQWLRAKVVREKDLTPYGLKLDPGAERAAATQRLVIMIHGFNSTPERTAELFAPVRAARLPCGTFSYPNDHALAESARLLSRELRLLRIAAPDRRVSLLAYSTGALVARACIENPALDPGNVRQLVATAPPNHGTLLAHFAVGTDVWEHALFGKGSPLARARASFADGLAEAVEDLRPGSPFLRELNARPRNGEVRYSIFLGTGGNVEEWELAALRNMVLRSGRHIKIMKDKFEKFDALLADMDELVSGRGDGVVAVKRGRLEGVEDTVLVSFDHLKVCDNESDGPTRRVHQGVLERLRTHATP